MRARHRFRPRNKYNAKKTVVDGIKFDSIKEAKYYGDLKLRTRSGDVIGFMRQVPLHLPEGIIYRMDFLEFMADGSCRGVEVKGYETPEWKLKKKLVDHHYPWLELVVVK